MRARAYRIPTQSKESDGTLEWDATGVVTVEVESEASTGVRATGLGYTYCGSSGATCVAETLAPVLKEARFRSPVEAWRAMVARVRNEGWCGIAAMAISAVDVALWDVWAKLRRVPVCGLLGASRECVPVYGSGGFTSYDVPRLQ